MGGGSLNYPMGVVNRKDIPDKRSLLGQFFTPRHVAELCLRHTAITTGLVVEPSCGRGAFLDLLRGHNVLALEVDGGLIAGGDVLNMNFYDYDRRLTEDVTFIGNPPYRTPAASVTADPVYGRRPVVRALAAKYGVSGIREEAVFFLLKTVDLILTSGVRGHIYYILPKAIFHNNSRAYRSFLGFLRKNVAILSVLDIPSDFANVTTDLCYVHFSVGYGDVDAVEGFYGVAEEMLTFHQIFKKTYLGSVPCEGVLLSVRGEPPGHFRERLHRLMVSDVSDDARLLELLSYGGQVHLAALRRGDVRKLAVVRKNVLEMRGLVPAGDFLEPSCYRPIRHRHEDRHYFRHDALKRARGFVYQLNPNPCPCFYFPGNPAKGCLDYYGFADYDVNRNCSPSANRTVPVQGVDDNLTDEFKAYWDASTDLPRSEVFRYLIHVLGSPWYRDMKSRYQRFYFGVPRDFDRAFKPR